MSTSVKFRNPYSLVKKTGIDLSRKTEDVYKLIPPFAVDTKTGEILNKSSTPKLVKVGVLNVYDKIQEFRDSVDLYKILEKVLSTGDESYLNRSVGSFADICDLPDNIHEFSSYFGQQAQKLSKMPVNIGKAILDNNVKTSDITQLIENEVKKQMIAQAAVKESEVIKDNG